MNGHSSPFVLKPIRSSRLGSGPQGEGECLAFLLLFAGPWQRRQINLGRNVWSRPGNLYQKAGGLCRQLIWKQAAPSGCQFRRDTGRRLRGGHALTEDTAKTTATQSRPGLAPEAMCWLSFQAHCAGNVPAGGQVVGSQVNTWALQAPGVPPGIEPAPLE